MTENEIKEYVTKIRHKADIFRKSGFETTGIIKAFDKSADIIEELLPYMAIGTIDEFKALKEKNEPKKPIERERNYLKVFDCPVCNAELYSGQRYCDECGQVILDDYE